MQRQRGELVPIGEVVANLDGPVQALIPSRSTQHHFTLADQVDQLVTASETTPDLGFMARLLALCSLPRSNPGNRHQYKRVNGPFKLIMIAGGDNKLPYGNLPRLILAWVCSEAVRTQSRELILGKSLSEFMRTLGVYSSSGEKHTRLRNQMKRLFGCTVSMIYENEHGEASVSSLVADRTVFLVERGQARPVLAVGKQDRIGRKVLSGNHQPPGSAQLEHPRGAQTLRLGTRSLPVVGLPDLPAPRSQTAYLAAPVQPVRGAPRPRPAIKKPSKTSDVRFCAS